jgi:hypothetical protein
MLASSALAGFPTPVKSPGGGEGLAVGDFNNDGRDDLLSFSSGSDTSVSVYLSGGDGTFRKSTKLTSATGELCSDYTGDPAGVDVNGDGNLDVVAGTFKLRSKIRYVMAWETWIAVADFTLYKNAWLGRGDGSFGPLTVLQQTEFKDWQVPYADFISLGTDADFNHDGFPDAAGLSFDNQGRGVGPIVVVLDYLGLENGTPSSPLYFDIGSTHLSTIASGDFDGDGWSDIVASGNNTLIVLLNDRHW